MSMTNLAKGKLSVVSDNLVSAVGPKNSWRQTIYDSKTFIRLSSSLNVSALLIVLENLNFQKLCFWLFPKILTEDQKNKRFECVLSLLTLNNKELSEMLSQIVTGGKT